MEKEIVELWEEHKNALKEFFTTYKGDSYSFDYDLLIKNLIEKSLPGFELIHCFTTGSYSGDIVIIFGDKKYDAFDIDRLYLSSIYYGSCSGCDALQEILSNDREDTFTEQQVTDLMCVALNIIQGAKLLRVRD